MLLILKIHVGECQRLIIGACWIFENVNDHDATSQKSTANAYFDDVSCALWGRTTGQRSILRHSKICVMAVKDSIWYMSNICSNTGWRYMVVKVKYFRPKLFKIKDPWSPLGSNLIFKIVDVKIHWSENWRFTTNLGAVWRFAININKPVKDSLPILIKFEDSG